MAVQAAGIGDGAHRRHPHPDRPGGNRQSAWRCSAGSPAPVNRHRVAARWSVPSWRAAWIEGRCWSPPSSASASRPARHRAATGPAPCRRQPRPCEPPPDRGTLARFATAMTCDRGARLVTGGIRVRFPIGPALVGNRSGAVPPAAPPPRTAAGSRHAGGVHSGGGVGPGARLVSIGISVHFGRGGDSGETV